MGWGTENLFFKKRIVFYLPKKVENYCHGASPMKGFGFGGLVVTLETRPFPNSSKVFSSSFIFKGS